jgi:hypothetical protein
VESCAAHVEKLQAHEKILAGAPLHPTSAVTTGRFGEGQRLLESARPASA